MYTIKTKAVTDRVTNDIDQHPNIEYTHQGMYFLDFSVEFSVLLSVRM
jgi:hypothetical protein